MSETRRIITDWAKNAPVYSGFLALNSSPGGVVA
jgi:hypothetical protein